MRRAQDSETQTEACGRASTYFSVYKRFYSAQTTVDVDIVITNDSADRIRKPKLRDVALASQYIKYFSVSSVSRFSHLCSQRAREESSQLVLSSRVRTDRTTHSSLHTQIRPISGFLGSFEFGYVAVTSVYRVASS